MHEKRGEWIEHNEVDIKTVSYNKNIWKTMKLFPSKKNATTT